MAIPVPSVALGLCERRSCAVVPSCGDQTGGDDNPALPASYARLLRLLAVALLVLQTHQDKSPREQGVAPLRHVERVLECP